jgi:hypothetical protein
MNLHPDFLDLLTAFGDAGVEYLVIGGYAVGFHARPRFTKDIDLWVGNDTENLERVARALNTFGAPPSLVQSFATGNDEDIAWMGKPPTRVDILRGLPGAEFGQAYARRVETEWEGVRVTIVGRDDLISLKRTSARDQDLLDVAALERAKRS